MSEKKWFTWQVEFKVSRNWVEDGFNLTDERVKDIIESALPFSYGWETKAKVLSSPNKGEILKVQGEKKEVYQKFLKAKKERR